MGLDEILDKIQINKFNLFAGLLSASQFVTGVSCFAYEIHNNIGEGFDENSPVRLLGGSVALLLSYLVGKHVPWGMKNQDKHYQNLTELLKKGYNEEACKKYMGYPCGRSVVKVALKRTDNSARYKELKEKYFLKTLW